MNTLRPFLLASALLTSGTFAQNTAAPSTPATAPAPAPTQAPATPQFKALAGPVELKDGDTFVFLGDSITHQCLYTQYVEDYYYTRFPKTRIHFHNAGVGGDRAADALRRFDDDVASFKPKYVSILLGMNDGSYTRYEQPIFDTYQRDMTTLLDKLDGIGAKAIPMTPTMHDARAARLRGKTLEPRDTYYNGVLALYGTWLREMAHQRGLGYVDMWSPLNNLTQERRRKDENFTLIKDAVHPDAPGQLVMAASIINDMVRKSPVSHVTAQMVGGKRTASAANGKVSELTGDDNGVSFTFEANALPWVVPTEAAEGFKLTHAGHRYSNEKITVRNLKPGKYELRIDSTVVGTYADGQLAFGVELEENAKTPQYQQALRVANLNKQRNDEAMRLLRNLWSKRKVMTRDLAQAEAKKAPDLDAKKEAYGKFLEEFKTQAQALVTKAGEFENRIYVENQPKPHKYEVVAIK
jgi:lysophospholipase L1-like esterase